MCNGAIPEENLDNHLGQVTLIRTLLPWTRSRGIRRFTTTILQSKGIVTHVNRETKETKESIEKQTGKNQPHTVAVQKLNVHPWLAEKNTCIRISHSPDEETFNTYKVCGVRSHKTRGS